MTTLCRIPGLLPLLFVIASCASANASPVGWTWTGGVTADSAVITARIDSSAPAHLVIDGSTVSVAPMLTAPMSAGTLHRFNLTGLKPDTVYRYHLVAADGATLGEEPRSFRPFPAAGQPASFRFAVASCAKGKDSPVFDAAARQGARFFLHTGDFHYYDIVENR